MLPWMPFSCGCNLICCYCEQTSLICLLLHFTFQVLVASLKFFLGKDEDEKQDSESESEVGVVTEYSLFCSSDPLMVLSS